MQNPAPVRRIAVTIPPPKWFHGIDRELALLHRQALVELGCSVFDIPIDVFMPLDHARINQLVSDLREFRPQIALGLCAGHYIVGCRLWAGRDGWRPNLFTEVLGIPTICLWDHAPFDLARSVIAPDVINPARSTRGALTTLQRTLTHPLWLHCSRDSWQSQLMYSMGLAPKATPTFGSPALPGFEVSASKIDHSELKVSFIGHFYQEEPEFPDPMLSSLATTCIDEWMQAQHRPMWNVLNDCVAAMPAGERQRLALDLDQTYFWHFANRLIEHHAQTVRRLSVLEGIEEPVACYGDLKMTGRTIPSNLRPISGHIPFGPALAEVFARHLITVDVLNPGWVNGYSYKPILGFASGGFVLLNRNADFIERFGEVGEAVSYSDADDLAAKVDRYLANPVYRRELGDEMRALITAHYRLEHFLMELLETAEFVLRNGTGVMAPADSPIDVCSVAVADLRLSIEALAHWEGGTVVQSAVGATITTGRQAWHHAAVAQLPVSTAIMESPHLRLRLVVELGRIGILLCGPDGNQLCEEHAISTTSGSIVFQIELPKAQSAFVVFRNTVDEESRVIVEEAVLCDRRS